MERCPGLIVLKKIKGHAGCMLNELSDEQQTEAMLLRTHFYAQALINTAHCGSRSANLFEQQQAQRELQLPS